MPLRDHFRPPVEYDLPWESLHSAWLGELTGRLNDALPQGFRALEAVRFDGRLEIDIGAYESPDREAGSAVEYVPRPAAGAFPVAFPGVSEVRVFRDRGGRQLVGAVELVSPGNKDRGTVRQAFVAKCVSYLTAGASLVVLDVVTSRRAVLADDIADALSAPPAFRLPTDTQLYAVAYRPVERADGATAVEQWQQPVAVGQPLPTMPLRLTGDLFVPVEFEPTYMEACRRRRLTD